jgi:hypothetical protein
MTKTQSARLKGRKRVRAAPRGHAALVRAYAGTIAAQRRIKADGRQHGGHDDLPGVTIAPPAVKPKGVKPQQIRKAVRTAVQEYVERHSKTLART